jgi:uncharacterized cupin superfamily protein
MSRPNFIKHCDELKKDSTFTYPGDSETFGTGACPGKELGLKRIAVNYEVLEPGDRSSWPHAHSEQEEFLFILEGKGQVWLDGNLYDVGAGDCIAFVAGTGIAHCLINNSNDKVRFLVVGEQNLKTDRGFYAKHPQRNEDMKARGFFWEGHPTNEMGPHDGWSDKKRPK